MFHLAAESERRDIGTAVLKRIVIAVYGIPGHLRESGAAREHLVSNAFHILGQGHLREFVHAVT